MSLLDRILEKLNGRKPTPDANELLLDGADFLRLIEHIAIDDGLPLTLIELDTLNKIVQNGWAFYDRRDQRWYLTPEGAKEIRPSLPAD